MRKILLLIFSYLFLIPSQIKAVVNPLAYPNNKYGIHITGIQELEAAADLVNSSGGDWGYLTLVVREDERDIENWQIIFDKMRQLHLIPILRLGTQNEGSGWKKFTKNETDNWVYFLNSLNWVIKNRYVIIANETNHANEWGGDVNPAEYVDILCDYSNKLKEASDDFFILPAGLDASAPDKLNYMKEEKYLDLMTKANPKWIDCIDGWNSHSYPNPGFQGDEKSSGQGTVKNYQWEISLLNTLGITKNIPVFITETGWSHNQNNYKSKLLSVNKIGSKYRYAFENVWSDEKVVAVTPFILDYSEPPFEQFSWKDKNNNFYPFYYEVKSLTKIRGNPLQEDKAEIKFVILPKITVIGRGIDAIVHLKNTGQVIWDGDFYLSYNFYGEDNSNITVKRRLLPQESALVSVRFYLPEISGTFNGSISVTRNGNVISVPYRFQIISVLPRPENNGIWPLILTLFNNLHKGIFSSN